MHFNRGKNDVFWQAPDYKGEIAREGPRGPKGYKGAAGYPGLPACLNNAVGLHKQLGLNTILLLGFLFLQNDIILGYNDVIL